MVFGVMAGSFGLAVLALVAFVMAFLRKKDETGTVIATPNRRWVWGGSGVVLAGAAAYLVVGVLMPGVIRARIGECEQITRETFRAKLTITPDHIVFDEVNRAAGRGGWQYNGVASYHEEAWDVIVTRDKEGGLRCDAKPRAIK